MIKAAYLLLYNAVCTVGWYLVLATVVNQLYETGDPNLASAISTPLVTGLQAIACLELVHALLGIVSGSPMSAFLQVSSLPLSFSPPLPRTPHPHPLYLSLRSSRPRPKARGPKRDPLWIHCPP